MIIAPQVRLAFRIPEGTQPMPQPDVALCWLSTWVLQPQVAGLDRAIGVDRRLTRLVAASGRRDRAGGLERDRG